jgi:hypothetical protein
MRQICRIHFTNLYLISYRYSAETKWSRLWRMGSLGWDTIQLCTYIPIYQTNITYCMTVLFSVLGHCTRTSNCRVLRFLRQCTWGHLSYGIRRCINWHSDVITQWHSIIFQKNRILNLKPQKTKQYYKQLIFFHQSSQWSKFLCHIMINPKIRLRLISE